jgi:16S rRNA (cytosine967-C5)-methyltransferase
MGEGAYDRVLLDAPCSGLGIIRRRPDIKLHRKPEDIPALAALQRGLLGAAARTVKPGGVLVYCTCTVTAEENEDNLRWFVQSHPFSAVSPVEREAVTPPHVYGEYGLQLLPGPHSDGFYLAKLVRDA